jgi:hypothetical protein
MDWKWKDFSFSDQQKIEQAICEDLRNGNHSMLSGYLTALLEFKCPLFTRLLKDALIDGINGLLPSADPRTVSSIIHGYVE